MKTTWGNLKFAIHNIFLNLVNYQPELNRGHVKQHLNDYSMFQND